MPAMSEAALYTQLTHLALLLDPGLALSRCKDDAERLQAQTYALRPCLLHQKCTKISGKGHTP